MTEERLQELLSAWPGAKVLRAGGEVRDGERAIVLGGHVVQHGGEARYYDTATGVQHGGDADYHEHATGVQHGGMADYHDRATATFYGGEYEQWGDARVTDKRKG